MKDASSGRDESLPRSAEPAPGAGETTAGVQPSRPQSAAAAAPLQVPGYEILRELGRGGMGVVYLAHNVKLDRREVLKVVNQALLDRPGVGERFLREMRLAAKLDHPNVVKAHSAPEAGQALIFAMEYVDGEDLAKVVQRQGPLSVPYACLYIAQAATGLQHAHEQGLVHRDIKPHNLIVTRQGEKHLVKILDFGLAKAKREGEAVTELTVEGAMMGTPAYMAPEQANDAASADIRADIYSLGCTLYFLLTGAPPFTGNSALAILLAHVSAEPTPLRQRRADAPAELEAVVARMIAKDPAHRYQQPIEAARALAPFLKPASTTTAAAPIPIPPTGAKKGSNRWAIAAALVVAALLLVGTIGLWIGGAFRGKTPEKQGSQTAARPSPLDCTGDKGVSAADVRKAQEAWANYLGRKVEEEDEMAPGVKIQFVLVPPGKFAMGSPRTEKDRSPDEVLHEVEITKPFYLGVYDVTRGQFRRFAEDAPYKTEAECDGKGGFGLDANKGTWVQDPKYSWRDPGFAQTDDDPVVDVTWNDAVKFRDWLNSKAAGGVAYRLPTEAEWEYSCRGGRPSSLPFGIGDGTSLSSREANFDGKYPHGGADKGPYLQKTTPGGKYKANAMGLYDMHGNVYQWCSDCYADYPPGPVIDPKGPAPTQGSSRVARGGGWHYFAGDCRAAYRGRGEPGYRFNNLGFRLARVPSGLDK